MFTVEEVLSLYQVDGIFGYCGVRHATALSDQEARENINPLDEKAMATIWEDTYFTTLRE